LLGERDTLVPADVAGDLKALLPSAHVQVLPGAGQKKGTDLFFQNGRLVSVPVL
jgi:hypothetical protein